MLSQLADHMQQEHAVSRYLIIADVHANLAALEAVIAAAAPFAQMWCVGDLVGYGPDPNACVQLIRNHNHLAVAGNHDLVACGERSAAGFNPDAARAAQWTARQLTPASRQYLRELPDTLVTSDFTLAHGSPRAPTQEYLFGTREARENFAHFATPYCLVGHTHVPSAFFGVGVGRARDVQGVGLRPGEPLPLAGRVRMIINPGSVGQPRDGDPRAAFGIYDAARNEFCVQRVAYAVAATQEKMRSAGLPAPLIERIAIGF